jgi:heme exporter protein CcmD
MIAGAAWSMGRYGGYVWSCYGLTLFALVSLAGAARRRWRMQLRASRTRVPGSKP